MLWGGKSSIGGRTSDLVHLNMSKQWDEMGCED